MTETKEIIQQWQYPGGIPPKLLEDKAFENAKKAGITSLQSYVTWAEIEKEPDKIDFSYYDNLVEKLKRHNLKWVPFFILGPGYATPDWFKKSDQSLFAQCLEHKKESKIQSIWSPFLPKWVDRFLRILSEHYQDKSILESICLGIGGNWGESLFPAWGDFYENFHTHLGWWCADKYALESFREYTLKKYGSLDKINNTWKTNFLKAEEINFPKLKYSFSFERRVSKLIPNFFKPALKSIYSLIKNPPKKENSNFTGQEQWLDFINWYTVSMTNWAEFWMGSARKYFPNNEIYLVTGGNGNPMLGADFSAQTKMAAKYNGGIRITNQTNNYAYSFALTRLVSSASRFYGSYFTTEEGGVNSPESITMRVFDTLTSGARGFYCKNIIGTGKDLCSKKFFPLGKPTKGAEILKKNLHFLSMSETLIVEAAVFFPKTSIDLGPLILDSLYNQCAKLRQKLNFDLLDENMIKDSALEHYKFFAIIEGGPLSGEITAKIEEWINKGGIFISQKYLKLFLKNNNRPEKIGQGHILPYSSPKNNYLNFIKDAIFNPKKIYPWQGVSQDLEGGEGIFTAQLGDKIICYNANNYQIIKKVGSRPIKIEANSISVV